MITWTDDYNGYVLKIIQVYIAQRCDGMHDVELTMIGGTARQLCDTLSAAHDVAELMVSCELPAAYGIA